MATLEQFWLLFPHHQQNEIIFKILKESFQTGREIHNDQVQRFFEENLRHHVYPTIQILNKLGNRIHKRNKIIRKALKTHIATILQSCDANREISFLNLLVNFEVSNDDTKQKFYKDLVSEIHEIRNRLEGNVYLSLLARKEQDLLKEFVEYDRKKLPLISKRQLLHEAIDKNQHFIELLMKIEKLPNELDPVIRNALNITKIVQILNEKNSIIFDEHKSFNRIIRNISADDLNETQLFFYNDLLRIQNILKLDEKHAVCRVQTSQLYDRNSVVDLLNQKTHLLAIGYDVAQQFLEKNYEFCSNQLNSVDSTRKEIKNTERDVLLSFYALATFCECIFLDTKSDDIGMLSENLLSRCKTIMRQIKDLEKFIQLLEDIFKLFFLRWEWMQHGNQNSVSFNETMPSSCSDETADPSAVRVQKLTAKPGFVCTKSSLEKILSFLRAEITKKYHTVEYKTAEDRVRDSLMSVSDSVNNAIWRLSLFEKLRQENECSIIEILWPLIETHCEILEKTSSDDENCREQTAAHTLPRRKPKSKRRTAVAISAVESMTGRYRKSDSSSSRVPLPKEDRGIVSKMLGTPENLAAVCLTIDDYASARQIIQTFNLKNKQLENEINLLENFQQTRKKLEIIFEKYEKQDTKSINDGNTESTIELLKKVASIGFEASKIINIIEKFAHTNPITTSTQTIILIEKFTKMYKFLAEYRRGAIQLTLIFDLILNFANNYEITQNIFSITDRLFVNVNDASTSDVIPEEIKNGGLQIGCREVFRNFVNCLFHLKNTNGKNIGLSKLLNESCYSLKSDDFKMELEKEKVFWKLYSIEISEIESLSNLKENAKLFDEFKPSVRYFHRFASYIKYLSTLLTFRDKANDHLSLSEIMEKDPKNIIGKLIFEENMTPLEIESIVSSLNLNLSHVICVNACPHVALVSHTSDYFRKGSMKKLTVKNLSIFNYIKSQNELLAFLLREIIEPKSQTTFKNCEYFENFLELQNIKRLTEIYENNSVIAALLSDYILIGEIQSLSDKMKVLGLIEDVEEVYEKRTTLEILKDEILNEIMEKDLSKVHFVESFSKLNLAAITFCKSYLVLNETEMVERYVKHLLSHKNCNKLEPNGKDQLERTLRNVRIFDAIAQKLSILSWKSAYDLSAKAPEILIEKLCDAKEFAICDEWCRALEIPSKISGKLKTIFECFMKALMATQEQEIDTNLVALIESFPQEHVEQFYNKNLENFRNLSVLKYVFGYLGQHRTQEFNEKIKNYEISIKIFEYLTLDERDRNWNLISRPLLLLEQSVMNSRFEHLASILDGIRPLLGERTCKFCFDKRVSIYDMPMNSSLTLGTVSSSEFILLNFDLYQKDHIITAECIDSILRIYGTKALDYRINEYSSTEVLTHSMSTSLDSLCGAFIMPETAPRKENWIKDEEALNCMCCKRAVFTIVTRRHHCRRCGRVVCRTCSTKRLQIPELYDEISVRVCDDCVKQTKSIKDAAQKPANSTVVGNRKKPEDSEWQFSGNLTHDKLLREEFCYEHAPNVALCLSILKFHRSNDECIKFMLHHCRKLEKILRPIQPGYPNPEIDYALVAKMLKFLALAAKVRGGPLDCDLIQDHSDIIMSVVKNGCEALLPMEELNNNSLRKLCDSLVHAEKWNLALEISLKCGFATAGVMAAYGLSCLRAGCFETAREKFTHCMPRLSTEHDNKNILKKISSHSAINLHKTVNIQILKRPNRSPPLLGEILKIIESTAWSLQPETLKRASIIRNSNTSLASTFSKRKENVPLHEPALNILNTLTNLKQITQGNYNSNICDTNIIADSDKDNLNNRKLFPRKNPRLSEECMFYLLSYGSHPDVIAFLIRNNELVSALKYFILQHLDNEIFVQNIFLPHLRNGKADELIERMLSIDNTMIVWKDVTIHTCRYLETKNQLNSLYSLQLLLKDPIRASITCVKFYSMGCVTFKDLQNNSFHLLNAQKHLQSELELCQWEDINVPEIRQKTEIDIAEPQPSFLMQMDAKTLNSHINTILRQLEVAKFLASCEIDGRPTIKILKQITVDSTPKVPTLFDSLSEKVRICVLILLCGRNVEEGFGLAFRVMQDYQISTIRVYGTVSKYLAKNDRLLDVEALVNCIKANNGKDLRTLDEILSLAVHSAANRTESEVKIILEGIIKRISNIETRIACHIFVGQLKSAYLLAIQNNRINDVRKILKQAEILNQMHIKRLCEKKLSMSMSDSSN